MHPRPSPRLQEGSDRKTRNTSLAGLMPANGVGWKNAIICELIWGTTSGEGQDRACTHFFVKYLLWMIEWMQLMKSCISLLGFKSATDFDERRSLRVDCDKVPKSSSCLKLWLMRVIFNFLWYFPVAGFQGNHHWQWWDNLQHHLPEEHWGDQLVCYTSKFWKVLLFEI